MKNRAVFLATVLIILTLASGGCGSKPPGPAATPQTNSEAKPAVSGSVYNPPPPEPAKPEKPPRRKRPDSPQLSGSLLAVIENSPQARPQSGLDRADLVFEALAEGGITRFLAVYYTEAAEKIGPIRSARYYFVEIARAFAAPFAHAGGNADALDLIPRVGIRDLDEIYNAGAFFRRSNDRRPPHNLYTSTAELLRGAEAKGFPMVPLKLLPSGEVDGGREAKELKIIFYGSQAYTSSSVWTYRGGIYWKEVDGRPHFLDDGTQITTDNVIVLATRTFDEKKEEWQVNIRVVGEGEAVFFTGGKAYAGKWRKASRYSHFEFLYQGKAMKFSPGQTWVEIVPGLDTLSYR